MKKLLFCLFVIGSIPMVLIALSIFAQIVGTALGFENQTNEFFDSVSLHFGDNLGESGRRIGAIGVLSMLSAISACVTSVLIFLDIKNLN